MAQRMQVGTKTQRDVLRFWFDNAVCAKDAVLAQHVVRWFRAVPEFDREIADKFGSTIEEAADGAFEHWTKSAQGRLALIIVLDQFTRNAFRGSPQAFSGDHRAQALCCEGLATDADLALTPVERHFFYLPLLHAEDRNMQNLSVASFTKLLKAAQPHQQDHFAACLDASRRYRDTISLFGHFPHRNAVLGRISTPEELRFLSQGQTAPRTTFAQSVQLPAETSRKNDPEIFVEIDRGSANTDISSSLSKDADTH